jgi:hypothetical protein
MYGAARSLNAELLKKGLITSKEYTQIDKACRKKYQQDKGPFNARNP